MRKVSKPFKRENKSGWWLRWQEGSRRITKSLPNKALADHFRHIKYQQLNSDVFIGTISVPFAQAKRDYLQTYEVRFLTSSAKYQATNTLNKFEQIIGPLPTDKITQGTVDQYLIKRGKGLSRYTIKKDISNLRAFFAWCKDAKYHTGDIKLAKLKTPRLHYKALTTEQIRLLFNNCPTRAWRCRILLSLVTGLRKVDIDNLGYSSIDLKTARLDSKSQKTGKVFIGRPLPTSAIPELASYVNSLPDGQARLFADINVRKAWDAIRDRAKLFTLENPGTDDEKKTYTITRQDFRRTFSTLIQKVSGIETAKDLLEHSSNRVTEDFYSDRELLAAIRVNRLPVKEWLKP